MKKVTYTASSEGIEKAQRALIRLGFGSKSNFAKSQLMSRSTVTKFFQRTPIQFDSFKRICEGLRLNWEEIAELPKEELLQTSSRRGFESLAIEELLGTISREVTVIDRENNTVKAIITLKGNINSVSNLRILESILREHSGDTITINDIEEGSIKLNIEGSPEDIQQLVESIKSGELTEINGFPIKDIQRLTKQIQSEEVLDTDDFPPETIQWLIEQIQPKEEIVIAELLEDTQISENSTKPKNKWDLVQEIVSQGAVGRDLSGVDLSDTDLSNANLSDADLSDANLSGADLSSANLSSADLSDADLSDANLTRANLSNADLSIADLSIADLSIADLIGAKLSGANLSGADLIGAKLNYAILFGATLRDANLRDANLSNANLSDTNLSDAKLNRAILFGANLSGADLSRANVQNTRLIHAKGISKELKNNLIKRGAIFEDSPGKDSTIYSPTPSRR